MSARQLPAFGGWRLPRLGAIAAFSNCPTAACEAAVVLSQCSEVLLECALAFTDSVSRSLSAMLRLNAFLRLALAGALSSPDRRGHSGCSARPSSRSAVGDGGCSPLCWGEATCAERLTSIQSPLRAVPTLYRRARAGCSAVLALVPAARSLLRGDVRPALVALLTVTGYAAQLLDLPSV